MLTQLSTVKTRLALTVTDYDDLLTNAIKAVSARFEETNRTLSRTATGTHEFDADDSEIRLAMVDNLCNKVDWQKKRPASENVC